MKHLFEILLSWSKPYISGTDLLCILNKSANSRQAIIKRAIQKGYLIPIRRDFYLIKNLKHTPVNTFEIAPLIYGPSHISFESALSFYGWIPEAVRTTTCATVKKTKEYDTLQGVFSYEHIPISIFSLGVEQHPQRDSSPLFIANPLKALADMIYIRKRDWAKVDDLFEDLRIETEVFQEYNKDLMVELIEKYPSQRVKKTLYSLKQGLSQ